MDLSRDEILGIIGRPRQAAQTQAAATQEADPDAAARSLSLSRETGVSSGIINADPENFATSGGLRGKRLGDDTRAKHG